MSCTFLAALDQVRLERLGRRLYRDYRRNSPPNDSE